MEGGLLEAVRCSDAQEVSRILASGADPNVPDELGETPIFEATAVGHTNIVALLLMSRADPEYRSSQGMVARQMALEHTALLLDLCSGKRIDAAAWEEGMAALSAPLRAPFARQFQGAPTMEEPSQDADPAQPTSNMDAAETEAAKMETGRDKEDETPAAREVEPLVDGTNFPDQRDSEVAEQIDHATQEGNLVSQCDTSEPLDGSNVCKSGSIYDAFKTSDSTAPVEDPPNQADPTMAVCEESEGGIPHIVLHSPVVALRCEPCMRSVVVRHLRPGDRINLGDWDATRQWRKIYGEAAWMPVRHPTLGTLARAEGTREDRVDPSPWQPSDRGSNPGPSLSVQDAWKQLYEGGILTIPPPNGCNESSIAGEALLEAAMGGKPTAQGEKALASLDLNTVEYVMKAALQQLHIQK